MSRTILFTLLNIVGFYLLFSWLFQTAYEYKKRDKTTVFFTHYRFRYVISILTIIGLPVLLFNYLPFLENIHIDVNRESFWYTIIFCGALALITALIWLDYILKLDIYEKEKRWHVFVVFVLSALLANFLTEPLYDLVRLLGYNLNDEPLNDFLYCVFSIGLIEELTKLLPLLLLMKFTKVVNEPYDFILYASISALGFAFSENIIYLNRYGPEVILARTFYSTVAHMTFSSTIAYGFLLKKYRYFKMPKVLVYSTFFGIAILAHGFFDFWLINPLAKSFSALTTLFFMITIHIWFTMINNAINISNFFSPKAIINNDSIKYQLVKNFLSLIAFSYLYVVLSESLPEGNFFLVETSLIYGYMMFYLIVGLSRFNVVRGYLKPFQIPFDFIIPKFKKED